METVVQVPSVHHNASEAFANRTCREEAGPSRLARSNSVSQRRSDESTHRGGTYHRPGGKRRQSFGASNEFKFKRRRHLSQRPTKFLLGGNIRDPLNLGSFQDEEINRIANAVTPESSPLPTPRHRTQVDVVIPANINDPLNLNGDDDESIKFSTVKPHKRRKKNKKKAQEDGAELSTSEAGPSAANTSANRSMPRPHTGYHRGNNQDKIVSPVVPQGNPRYHHGRWHSRGGGGRQFRGNGRSWRGRGRGGNNGRERHNSSATLPDKRDSSENRDRLPSGGSSEAGSSSQTAQEPTTSNANQAPNVNKGKQQDRFIYGNYNRYYGYRNGPFNEDARLSFMKESWFNGKDLLDIGCNVGHFTLAIAHKFHPRKTIGLDIDKKLILAAKKNVRHYLDAEIAGDCQFPMSLPICHGPLAGAALGPGGPTEFPNNVFFITSNYVLENDALLETQQTDFDVILCLSVTKWVQLNWGDEGLKRLFKRCFRQLRPGGRFILEPQPFSSYKRRKFTPHHLENFKKMQLLPEAYAEYLMSPEVGFAKYKVIKGPAENSKGFERPIYIFRKAKKVIECTPPMECDTTTFIDDDVCSARRVTPPANHNEDSHQSANQEPESTSDLPLPTNQLSVSPYRVMQDTNGAEEGDAGGSSETRDFSDSTCPTRSEQLDESRTDREEDSRVRDDKCDR